MQRIHRLEPLLGQFTRQALDLGCRFDIDSCQGSISMLSPPAPGPPQSSPDSPPGSPPAGSAARPPPRRRGRAGPGRRPRPGVGIDHHAGQVGGVGDDQGLRFMVRADPPRRPPQQHPPPRRRSVKNGLRCFSGGFHRNSSKVSLQSVTCNAQPAPPGRSLRLDRPRQQGHPWTRTAGHPQGHLRRPGARRTNLGPQIAAPKGPGELGEDRTHPRRG